MTVLPRVLSSPLLAAMVLGGLLTPSPATAGDDEIAPPPLAVDRSGSDQDEFFIPSPTVPDPESQAYTSYVVDGEWLTSGWYPTKGAASVTVTSVPDHGTWVLDFSSEVTGSEAEDAFKVSTGECFETDRDSLRTVTVSLTNKADGTGRYIRALEVVIRLAEDGSRGDAGDRITVGGEPWVTRLEDGETTSVELFDRDGGGWPDSNSGGRTTLEKQWRVTVMRSDRRDRIWTAGADRYKVFDKVVSLPRCDMARYDRGCRTSTATLLARETYEGPSSWRYRISLARPGRRADWTTHRVPAGEPRQLLLRRGSRAADTKVRVQFYNPRATYHYNGGPGTHWSREVSRVAWGSC